MVQLFERPGTGVEHQDTGRRYSVWEVEEPKMVPFLREFFNYNLNNKEYRIRLELIS